MRTSDEAELRSCVLVFPHDGIVVLDSVELGVVNDIDLCALGDKALALLNRFGSQLVDVIETDSAVGSGSRAEILEVCLCIAVKLGADPLIKTLDIGDIFHDLHADSGAENLSLGLLGGFDFDYPCSLSALVGDKSEIGDTADDGTEELDYTGVSVAACAENRVCIDNSRGLSP